MRRCGLIMSVCAGLAAMPAYAAQLKPGDRAPALQIAHWVQGEAVDLQRGGGQSVYVIEFWATWCPSCRESMPYLSQLQKSYESRDVIFIGITDEARSEVEKYVRDTGAKMSFTVACDDQLKTSKAYMLASGQMAIPTVFIIDKQGRIAWIGHPAAGMDGVLEQVVQGTFDIAQAAPSAPGQTSPYMSLAALPPDLKVSELKSENWYWRWAVIIGFTAAVTVVCFKNPKRTHNN